MKQLVEKWRAERDAVITEYTAILAANRHEMDIAKLAGPIGQYSTRVGMDGVFESCANELESELSKSPWISVREQLPYTSADFVVVFDTGRCGIASWGYGRWWGPDECSRNKVTHWMPIPPLPKNIDTK